VSYLLDTSVLSELRKGKRANPRVVAWFEGVADKEVFISVLVLGELRQGVERVRRRDPAAAARLERWLDALATGYADRALPVDDRIADLWGRLSVPDPLPAVDGLLAATALVHNLTLVTRNVRDVEATGAEVFNPFD
jgi:predicted nucleic acid-binding protein